MPAPVWRTKAENHHSRPPEAGGAVELGPRNEEPGRPEGEAGQFEINSSPGHPNSARLDEGQEEALLNKPKRQEQEAAGKSLNQQRQGGRERSDEEVERESREQGYHDQRNQLGRPSDS
jgi:hypothetical protein